MPDIDQNTDFGGGNILNRFAISALSKKYRNQAINEELIVDKTTGEYLVKSPLGTVMSIDAINRRRSTIIDATSYALMQNMYGNMYEIKVDGLAFPEAIKYEKNILSEPVELKTNLKKLLFFIDLDEVITDTEMGEPTENEPTVFIRLVCECGSESKDIVIEKRLKDINNNIIDIKSIANFNNDYNVKIESLSFKKNTSNTYNTVLILQNIIVSLY